MKLREGDIYKWYFKNDAEYRRNNPSTAYWCMDNQAVVHNGKLIDTYWIYADKGRFVVNSDCNYLDVDKVDLKFICNLNEIEFIKAYQVEDYDKVYDLSYQKGCYKLFAIDKGAQVSKKALRAKYLRELAEAEQRKRSAEWDIERYTKAIEELDNE